MATRTWAGTLSANWNTAGNWVEVAVPTAADDVVIGATGTANNMTLNIATPVCRSIDFTTYTAILTIPAATTLTIGDGTAGAGNIAMKIVSGMTVTLGDPATSAVSFISTSATVQTIAIDAKVLGNVTFNATSNGSWQLTSAFACTGGTITLTKGTLDMNGQTVTALAFSSTNSNVRTLTLGAASITLSISGTTGSAWTTSNSANMTLNANTSTITFSGTGPTFSSGGLTYNHIVMNNVGSQVTTIAGTNAFTCNNFTWSGTSGTTATFQLQCSFTVTGTLTLTGATAIVRGYARSDVFGSARTITCSNAPSLTNMDFQDITAAGAGGTWSGTSLGDCYGNSNITFTTPVTRYAVAAGNWNSTTIWSATNGGGSGASVPLVHDTVYINSNSGVGTITCNLSRACRDIDFTGAGGGTAYTGTYVLGNSAASRYFGSMTLSSAMTLTLPTAILSLQGRSTHTLTTAGKTFFSVTVDCIGGSYTLQDALTMTTGVLLHNSGTFNTNGFSITAVSAAVVSNSTILTLGASTLTFTSTSGTPWSLTSGVTLNAGTSNIVLNGGTASTKTFAGDGVTYFQITFSGSGTGAFITTGSFTTNVFAADTPPHTIQITAGTTITTNVWSIRGVSGSIFTLQSTTGGSAWNLSKTGGKISTDWISLQDSVAAGGAIFYAGRNSTNVSGNTGWRFTAAKDFGFAMAR